jgi:hypothetical protein
MTGQQTVFERVFDMPDEWKQLQTPDERRAVKDFMKWIIENRNRESNITFNSSRERGVTNAKVSEYKDYHR